MEDFFFNDKGQNSKRQLFFALFFPIFTIIALGLDAVSFTQNYFDARQITNFLAILYFLGFFFASNRYLRKLLFTMVFLSYIGELIFCKLLGFYNYRTISIPLYVPFGHAIVYASGYVFSQQSWIIIKEKEFRYFFALFFIVLFLSVGFFLGDLFSILFGVFFFLLLNRKQWQNLYYCIAICVIFIELVGTFFQCWIWESKIFGAIPTANPPMGAVFFYAGGDVLLAKIVGFWENKRLKIIS